MIRFEAHERLPAANFPLGFTLKMTISRPASILSIPLLEYDHQGFKLKDDLTMEPLHNPVEILNDDPLNDIDPSDVDRKELIGWYAYGFAAEGFA